jgi:isocitrate lyase
MPGRSFAADQPHLQRADQIEHAEGGAERDWFVPIVADAEAGSAGR